MHQQKVYSRYKPAAQAEWASIINFSFHSFAVRIDAFSFPYFVQFFPSINDPAKFAADFPGQVHQMKLFFLERWSFTPFIQKYDHYSQNL